jgi:PAS domain S-box-containing protein
MFSPENQAALLELNHAILVELDGERRIRGINARGGDLLGATVGEIRGRDWLEFFDGIPERETASLLLTSTLASSCPCEREFDVLDCGGGRRRIHWRCIAIRSVEGRPAGWLCAGVDLTEHALREQDAHMTQERLTRVARLATMGEMAAGMAHEINQPLTAITSYARAAERYLDRGTPDLAELRDVLREINAEGLRAGGIIHRLRQMVRAETPEECQRLDLNQVLTEIRSLLHADARAHGVQLRLELEPGLPAVLAHGVQLQQVVLNLARNAFEALLDITAHARQVCITSSRAPDRAVEVCVTDNGPGIAPQIADRLFDPFVTTKGTGTGLGLAIIRTIVRAHGGTIEVRPAEPSGTIFRVRLPAHEDTA